MKIVISAAGKDMESNIDCTFGGARFFLIGDTTSRVVNLIENNAIGRPNGVGISAKNTVEKEGIDGVVTADSGSFAFETFEQEGVKVFYKTESRVNNAIQLSEEGKLLEITKATRRKYGGFKQKRM